MSLNEGPSDRAHALLLCIATFAVYVWVSPGHLVYGDNAEFAGLAQLGGVAHPPGYPLYVLWLRAWSWLPVDGVVAAAIATASVAAAQIGVLYIACRAWGAGRLPATLAVGLYAVSPIALRIHSQAEVFALNGLIVALVLWLSARTAPALGVWRIALLALVAGLGIANHLTCVLVAPIGVLGIARGVGETGSSRRLAALGAGVLALGVGLAPYAYLFVAPDSPMSWGRIDDLPALAHHFLRQDYGGPWGLSGRRVEIATSDNLVVLASSLRRAYWYVPAVAGVAGLGFLAVRGDRSDGETRPAWIALAVSFVLAGPLLISRFNVPPHELARYVVERFHLLPLAVLAVPVAVTLDRAATYARFVAPLRRPVVATGLVIATLACAMALSLPGVARAHSVELERGLANILRSLPRDSVLLVSTDSAHFGLGYLQAVRGERRDVMVITTPQLGRRAYRDAIAATIGFPLDLTATRPVLDLVENVLSTKRPLFIDPLHASVAAAYPSYPYGIVFRVVPRGDAPPPVREVFVRNQTVFAAYDLGYPWPAAGQPTELHHYYARTWRMIGDGLAAAGLREEHDLATAMTQLLSARDD